MQVNQKLSLLFFPKRRTKTDEWATLYARVTIDGIEDEFSLSIKVRFPNWSAASKSVDDAHSNAKEINTQIRAAEVDLKRHFLLIQAQKGIVLPRTLLHLIKRLFMVRILKQRQEYTAFQSDLITLCWDYVRYSEKRTKILDDRSEIYLS